MTRTHLPLLMTALLAVTGCSSESSGGSDWDVGLDSGERDTEDDREWDTVRPELETREKPDGAADGSSPVNPKVDIYFVVDGDGSQEYADRLRTFLATYVDHVVISDLKNRFGLTNMHPDNEGHLYDPPGWHYTKPKLLGAFEDAAVECQSSGSWTCPGSDARGLQVARDGVEYMNPTSAPLPPSDMELRSDARLVVVFLTDDPPGSVDTDQDAQSYVSYFEDRATVFAVKVREDCATSATTGAYKTVATESGGKYANVCDEDLSYLAREYVHRIEPGSR